MSSLYVYYAVKCVELNGWLGASGSAALTAGNHAARGSKLEVLLCQSIKSMLIDACAVV